ncbi:PREDICTED: epithelial-stromal interaction protein 1 isoform X2 [Pseudopodoces humilis]|uniref:epithelial-stromal interaction protein 1 isoform X2 n=1 Tax=Pseudopodoces humilis TaxID=181119 RepID=UPI0006B82DB9|nr:PREDICTED: epithelial-stromal interaction protein 1 isoform X2 [Pseudopodoces humilis]XP_014118831.1 PREDICTED: epithelial-stromal interaction protein 1 isoform X2 [Pseudopodoces humilis]XP_014118833.1 PREDICTED: epithelial-stromal interaction protein 1 isoform X2 [Pseudopodoces humilis]
MEKGENAQKLTASEEKRRGQASAHPQQQHRYVGPYVLVTPNETRRKQLQQIAKKELDDLEQWKKEHRPGPIMLVPQRLGGNESETQVRQNQQMILMQSKYQKKAERLEVKKRQEEMQRREMLLEDQKYKTNELLNRLDVGLPKSDSCQIANPGPESIAWKRSLAYKQALGEEENRRLEEMKQEQQRKAELMEFKQKQEDETRTKALKKEQRRVNNAFLDRLQNKTQSNNIYHPGNTGLPQ